MAKEVLILSDGKAGHLNQSRALTKILEKNTEIGVKTIEVKFRSKPAGNFFSLFAFMIYPFIRSNIPLLNRFIEAEALMPLEGRRPDIIVSSGGSIVPLNILLSKIYNAKRIVLMSPSFPFYLFRYDLALVPSHDKAYPIRGRLKTLLALSPFDRDLIENETLALKKQLPHPQRVKIGLLIGGDAKGYKFNSKAMDWSIDEIIAACQKLDADFIVTTCRRTPHDYEQDLKLRLSCIKNCQLFVQANKTGASNFVSGLLGLCSIIIATDESISMISEPIRAGKKPVVLKLNKKPSGKILKFQVELLKNNLINIVEPDRLCGEIIRTIELGLYGLDEQARQFIAKENEELRERLKALI